MYTPKKKTYKGLKALIILGTFIGMLFLCYHVDESIINSIIGLFPPSAADWFKLIRVVLWILAIVFTSGIAIAISAIITLIVIRLLDRN